MIPQEDPFSSVRIKKSQKMQEAKVEPIQQESDDIFKSVRMKKEPEESFFDNILRGGTRTASRVAETFLGIPGDVSDIIQSGVLSGLETLVGFPAPDEAHEKMKGYRPPTSQELQSASEFGTKGYTKPQNENEKEFDEFTKTVASLLGPIKFRKALGLATLGTGVGKGLEVLGFDEPVSDAAKFGTIFTLSMFNPKGVQNLYSGLYDKVKKSIPNKIVNVKGFETRLNSIERNLKKGVSTTTKNAVLKPIEELKLKIKDGKMSAEDLITARFDLNELMGDPELLKRGKNSFPLVTRALNKAIKESPDLSKKIKDNFIAADEAYGAFQQSKKASNFIKKSLPSKPLKSILFTEGIQALAFPESVLPTAAGIAGTYGALKIHELLSRINANPTMRKYYLEMLKSASEENKISTLKFIHKLDEELEKKD